MKHRKVFIDSRQDPFPIDLVIEHIEVERTGEYRRMFDRYGIECALTHQGCRLRHACSATGGPSIAPMGAGPCTVGLSGSSRCLRNPGSDEQRGNRVLVDGRERRDVVEPHMLVDGVDRFVDRSELDDLLRDLREKAAV